VPFLAAGCVACGIGGALADPALARAGRHAEIEARARAFVARVASFAGEPIRRMGPAARG
jgi:2-keto-3-deoxy-6-phosphogluconate aldolase